MKLSSPLFVLGLICFAWSSCIALPRLDQSCLAHTWYIHSFCAVLLAIYTAVCNAAAFSGITFNHMICIFDVMVSSVSELADYLVYNRNFVPASARKSDKLRLLLYSYEKAFFPGHVCHTKQMTIYLQILNLPFVMRTLSRIGVRTAAIHIPARKHVPRSRRLYSYHPAA